MIGLALQGGGARGSYQIGAYYALKKAKIKFDGVCGTSIGAFNGAMIASGKEKELLKFWQNVSIGEILGFNKEYIQKKITGQHDFSYYKESFKYFFHVIKSKGIAIEGLEKILKENVDKDALINSSIDFGICTLRIHDLKPLYIFKENMNIEKMYDYIMASCYLPLFKMEKKIDSHYYLDGGFYDNTPINMLIKKGYDKIYVVELNPLINRKRKPLKNVEIIKITPKRSLGAVVIYDPKIICENIKMGYYDTLRIVKHYDGYHYCFKNYPVFIYSVLTRKIARQELNHVMGFFNAKNEKETVIKAMEYVMRRENIDYYKVYNPIKILVQLKKYKKKHFIYSFINKLKFYI